MSGGERQRIGLGRAFIGDSRAILMDEPIAALDARLREEMRVELKRLQREKIRPLSMSHTMKKKFLQFLIALQL